jgi:hypothetical protein
MMAASVLLALGLALALAITFAYKSNIVEHQGNLAAGIAAVDPSDGFDLDEARSIASAYSGDFISGCGGADEPRLVKGIWEFPVRIGYAGKLVVPILRIDAASGKISYRGGPTFPGFRSFRFVLLWGAQWRSLFSDLEIFDDTPPGS